MDDSHLPAAQPGMLRRRRILVVTLKALLPVLLIGGTAALVLALHLDGTLRAFLDRQSMGGMILVVLAVNAVGFSFVYMAAAAWKSIKREFRPDDDW